MAFYKIEPFGQQISDTVTANVAALLYNANRRKGSDAAKPSDFMPKMRPEQQTPQQMKTRLRSILSGNRKVDQR